MVSIIIPNYNRSKMLRETLLSVINQSYQDWEAIIVDDGSTDDSFEKVRPYIESNQRVIWMSRVRHPKGASTCRNIGVQIAKGDYIIFLDSDDLLAPYCLEQRVKILNENPDLDFAVFPMNLFYNKPGDSIKLWNVEPEKNYLDSFLNLDPIWQTTGPIWRKHSFLRTGGFSENLTCWQDLDIHLKAILAGLNIKTFYDLPVDCYYRKHSIDTISQSNHNSLEKLESRAILYFWIIRQLNKQKSKVKLISLNIIISAIKSLNIRFAFNFWIRSKQRLTLNESVMVLAFFIVYPSRLYKFKIITTSLNKWYNTIQPEINVGKFTK